jgi:hypothetical protein
MMRRAFRYLVFGELMMVSEVRSVKPFHLQVRLWFVGRLQDSLEEGAMLRQYL